MPSNSKLSYEIGLGDLQGHYFDVRLEISKELAATLKAHKNGVMLRMPAWIPGSYMIRDFSKHVSDVAISVKNISFKKVNSHTWQIEPFTHSISVTYRVYAFDTSVRTAYLDHLRGFFNPTSLCMEVVGAQVPYQVKLSSLGLPKEWVAETTLAPRDVNSKGFGVYEAAHYDELIDHPVALGVFQRVQWKACGIPHEMVIQGALCDVNKEQLASDLKAICESQITFFDPDSKRPPFDRYLFMVNAVGDGYGGLEHRSSTALLCKRDDLPYKGKDYSKDEAYQDFLGLCSHEYFHAWMVKRVKPERFIPYDLSQPNHSTLLWLFEGFTSYYDDLHLLRSHRIDLKTYLKRIEKTWNMVLRGPGRRRQTVAESSYDAWTKYYQMDENTPNTVVSYYAKGALIALQLDLEIRAFTKNRHSLDDFMRHLYQMYQLTQRGVDESDLDSAMAFLFGPDFLSRWLAFKEKYIHGTLDLPLAVSLSQLGYKVFEKSTISLESAELMKQTLGIKTTVVNGWVKVTHVLEDGWAKRFGLAAGDVLGSMGKERVTAQRFDAVLKQFMRRLSLGEQVSILAYRHEAEISLIASKQSGSGPLQYEILMA